MTVLRSPLLGTAAAASGFSFVVYLLTLAPSMTFIDAGELAAVAHTFGIAHPTGYPLFTLVGGLWAQLPIGSGIWRMNLLSALFCAATVGVLVLFIHSLLSLPESTRARPEKGKGKDKGKAPGPSPHTHELDPTLRLGIAAASALFIGFSETFWSTALSIEVYSLHLLLLSLTLWLYTRVVFVPADQPGMIWRLRLFALVLGLSFTNHMTTILVLPAMAVLWFWTRGVSAKSWRALGSALPTFLVGLLPYLYLPLRAATGPALNWGNPASWDRFLWHVSGKQYRVWIFASGEAASRQFSYFLKGFPAEFGYIGLFLLLLGLPFGLRRQPRATVFLLLLFVGCVFYAINYDIHDIDSYFLLAYIATGVLCAYGLVFLLTRMIGGTKAVKLGVAALAVGILIGIGGGRVSQQGNTLVEDYTRNMFASLRPHALVLSFQWDYWVSASYYYQLVEGWRPDVTVIDKELLRRSWYLDQIQRNHPALYARSRDAFESFRRELDKFEHEQPYVFEEIEGKYQGLINSLVEHNYADRPVYMTVEMDEPLAPGFERVPEGLAMRLYRPQDLPSADTRVWDDFTIRPFTGPDRLVAGIQNMYVVMLVNRGVYLHERERYQDADVYFRRALALDPTNRDALRWKQRNADAMSISEGRSMTRGKDPRS